MYYYKFNIGDYKSHTSHLDHLEDLAFRRMLDWQYLHERYLPLDIPSIGKAIGMRTHHECIEFVLHEFYEETPDGYTNRRVEQEIAEVGEKSAKARESANTRWQRQQESERIQNAERSQCEGNATQDPRPKTQDTNTHSPSGEPDRFDEFWDACPKKVDKKKARTAFARLSKAKQDVAIADYAERYQGTDKKYIPGPLPYIHGEKWEDEKPIGSSANTSACVPAGMEDAI